ncbi:carbonic anhydrase, partial [Flagellimonas halotolerans]
MSHTADHSSITDRIVDYVNGTPNYSEGLHVIPRAHLAVVTCMDSRIEVSVTFGLQPGEAHILHNAGGLITTDTLRSLSLSQIQLG